MTTEKKGLYANIHAKQDRIAHGSGEQMREAGEQGPPTEKAFKQSEKTAKGQAGAVGAKQKSSAGKLR